MQKRETTHPQLGKIVITYNQRARKIIMRARFDAIYITVPPYTPDNEIARVLAEYGDRLKLQQEKLPQERIDCNFRIETQHLRLHLEKSTSAGIVIKGKNGVYTLLYGPETDFGCKDTQQTLHRGITAAVLHRAKEILPQRLQQLSGQHNLHCKKITVRNTSTHWGSCSSSGTISLNLHLILLPQHLIDYVILHELCHTVEMNHSPRFWALLDELCDTDSKRLRAELKSYKGNIL
jgi:predicted metal-dependent hydrolase